MNKNTKQENEDTINLASVNNTNKPKKNITIPSYLKKQKGPKRDEEGKFVASTGGGGLDSNNKFNWKRIAPLIAVVALVGGFFVYNSFAMTGSSTDDTHEVLRAISADQMIPRGYSRNPSLQEFVHTGNGTEVYVDENGEAVVTGGHAVTTIGPGSTLVAGRWGASWPDKIKVCAITYQQIPLVETTVEINVSSGANRISKSFVLQKQKNLNPRNKWPKHEICSGPVSNIQSRKATRSMPGYTMPPSDTFMIQMKTVSVCAKKGQRISTLNNNRCQSEGTIKYPPSVPYLEQYIIKKA